MLTHRIVAYLITLAVGYWILTKAESEKDHVKTIGKVIAWIIIVVSLIGPVCMVTTAVCRHACGPACCSSMGCPSEGWHRHGMGGPGMMMNGQCPMGGPNMMMQGQEAPGAKGMPGMEKPAEK
jgi:hypothetical protein